MMARGSALGAELPWTKEARSSGVSLQWSGREREEDLLAGFWVVCVCHVVSQESRGQGRETRQGGKRGERIAPSPLDRAPSFSDCLGNWHDKQRVNSEAETAVRQHRCRVKLADCPSTTRRHEVRPREREEPQTSFSPCRPLPQISTCAGRVFV
ncbi:uncharacterized protein BKA78DRAFT_168095 [Phyllosticta capitalensis]|uniref:uncharacterized protein n=1 Tax=Phyllosticta capitalensis TaxID=121624 RepID=UPI00313265EE